MPSSDAVALKEFNAEVTRRILDRLRGGRGFDGGSRVFVIAGALTLFTLSEDVVGVEIGFLRTEDRDDGRD